jgi:hypothetical protein
MHSRPGSERDAGHLTTLRHSDRGLNHGQAFRPRKGGAPVRPDPHRPQRRLPIEDTGLPPSLEHGRHGAAVHAARVLVENDIGRASRPFLPSPDLDVLDIAGDQMSDQVAQSTPANGLPPLGRPARSQR